MARSRYKFAENHYPHFLTCTTVYWLPLFASPHIVNIIAASLTFLRINRDVKIFAYVIMENHLHMIAAGEKLSQKVGHFKSYTARQIVDYLEEQRAVDYLRLLKIGKKEYKTDQDYQVWQEGSHPQVLTDEMMMAQKIDYIHQNPLCRGYVEDPVHWLYSSARNYAGMDALIEIDFAW
ncbi:transposase [candidate division KSB1 bacterium]|nr:transposase [candidate division KSB1 bacterium]